MEVDYRLPFRFESIGIQQVPINMQQVQRHIIIGKVSIPWENIYMIEDFVDVTNPFPDNQQDKCKLIFNNMAQYYVVLDYSYEVLAELFDGYKLWKRNQFNNDLFKKN